MKWPEIANKESDSHHDVMTFSDYMEYFENNTSQEVRPTCQYLLDMMDSFGQDEEGHFKLFQEKHYDSPSVFGQYKTQEAIYQNLKNFSKEGFNNRLILLIGPNGSSKSTIIKKFMTGAEEYSKTNEGALYTFSWIFPIDTYIKGTLGLGTKSEKHHLQSYAHLDDKDVSAILTSEMKDHPILLIPKAHRQEFIDEGIKEKNPELWDTVTKSYLYEGDLSKRNRMIYDALLKNYKGDHGEVLKHVRIERFDISKRYSVGAVSIEPQMHIDARMQQITIDKRLAGLPPSLQSLNLFSMQGEIVLANRGVLEYSDLLKRPLDTFKYLLMTMETANINLQGILTELDIFFVGTSNELHFEAFRQHPDFKSFSGRFNFVKVPYLLNHREEEFIYKKQVEGLKDKSHFEPHSLNILCLFAVMTRLRKCQSASYIGNKKLGEIAILLTPLEKTLFYATKELPGRLDVESKQTLEHGINEISSEFENDNLYEGKFGISPREIQSIIYHLTSKLESITFLDIIEYLEKMISQRDKYDFLNMTPQGTYHNFQLILKNLKEYALDHFNQELGDSLGLVDDRSYESFIKQYIQNINSLIKKEKVLNEITGKYENADEYFIKEFETNMALKEDPDKYRSLLISRLGAYSLDNPGKEIIYSEVFPIIVHKLQDSFKEEQSKFVKNVANNLVFYEAELISLQNDEEIPSTPLTKENRKDIETILTNLTQKYKYSQNAAITLLKFIIKERF